MACSKVSDICDVVKKCQDVFSRDLNLSFKMLGLLQAIQVLAI